MAALIAVVVAVSITGCGKKSVIPDDTLANIFHDAFMVNAYIGEERLNLDSLKVYEPIFEKYGYTVEDLHLTINSFSKRKSARLSDAVELAIQRLERESDLLNAQVADLDTIDAIARRASVQQIYFDSAIHLRSLADTAKMKIRIPVVDAGDYQVEYYFYIDPEDKNSSHRTIGYFLDSTERRSRYHTMRYRRMMRDKYVHTFRADTTARVLVLELCNLNDKPSRPNFKIDSLTVRYYPAREIALDTLTARNFAFRLLVEGFYTPEPPATAADSALYFANPPRIE